MRRTTLYLAVIIIISILFACTEEAPITLVSPVIDHIAPFIEWVDPESGSELSGTVELVFSIYDENVIDSVRLLKNGAAVATYIPPGSRGGTEGGVMGDTITHSPAADYSYIFNIHNASDLVRLLCGWRTFSSADS